MKGNFTLSFPTFMRSNLLQRIKQAGRAASALLVMLLATLVAQAQITLLQDYQNYHSAPIGTFQGINFRLCQFAGCPGARRADALHRPEHFEDRNSFAAIIITQVPASFSVTLEILG